MLKEIIIFPTDTVYGIGASLFDLESIEKIYQLKGREFNKQLPILVSSIEQAKDIAVLDERFHKLAKVFWPGPLTIVLKTTNDYFLKTKEETVALRMPNHPVALKIIDEFGPLKTTSVNKSHEEPLNDYLIIKEKYQNIVKTIYDNNIETSKVSSTIIDITNDLKILRQGEITLEQIEKILNKGE